MSTTFSLKKVGSPAPANIVSKISHHIKVVPMSGWYRVEGLVDILEGK